MAEVTSKLSPFKRKALIAGGIGLAGAKIYALDKYANWHARRKRMREGFGVGPTKFAGLPRRKQQGILYYKRRNLGALEHAYDAQRGRRGGGGLV